MHQQHRCLQAPGQLGQAEAVKQSLMQAAGGFQQGEPVAGGGQLLTQLLKTRAGIQVTLQQPPLCRERIEHMQGGNQVRFR